MLKTITKNAIIYITLLIFFITLHEIAHGITAVIFGGKWLGFWITDYIGYGKKGKDVNSLCIYTYTTYNNGLGYCCVKIAGSLTSILIAFIINRSAKKKENYTIYLITSNVILYELLYWSFSPILGFGDAFQLLSIIRINPILFSTIFFIILILSMIYLGKDCLKLIENRYN